jgi:hypothetical protein
MIPALLPPEVKILRVGAPFVADLEARYPGANPIPHFELVEAKKVAGFGDGEKGSPRAWFWNDGVRTFEM